jgi:hypothetical protein
MTKTDTWQTRPLVREGAPPQKKNYKTVTLKKNLWSKIPDWARHQDILTDWPSVAMWLWLWLWTEDGKIILALYDYCLFERPPLWSNGQRSWLQNGDVLCFLWGTNRIYIRYVEESRPPLWSSGQSSWLQNGDVLCFLWGTNWIYLCYVEESRPPLWSSGQSSWLHNGDVSFPVRYELNLFMLCRRK